ncbi:hypothetical protein L1887_24280 [Cichorium endivia]|nr:hypothetical protein L1887_24280 [Cichorium endivia]
MEKAGRGGRGRQSFHGGQQQQRHQHGQPSPRPSNSSSWAFGRYQTASQPGLLPTPASPIPSNSNRRVGLDRTHHSNNFLGQRHLHLGCQQLPLITLSKHST